MGIVLMILGLASAGLVADFVLENHLASAPAESFTLFGSTISVSVPALVLGAFVAGALTIVLLKAGMVLARQRGAKRRALRRRVADLEAENAKLRTTDPVESSEPVEPTGETLPDTWAASSSADR